MTGNNVPGKSRLRKVSGLKRGSAHATVDMRCQCKDLLGRRWKVDEREKCRLTDSSALPPNCSSLLKNVTEPNHWFGTMMFRVVAKVVSISILISRRSERDERRAYTFFSKSLLSAADILRKMLDNCLIEIETKIWLQEI